MALIKKSFDVKIKVYYPHLSHSIPQKDSRRIQSTNFNKYEPQKTIESTVRSVETPVRETEVSLMERITDEYKSLENDFSRLEEKAGDRLKSLVYNYDPSIPGSDAMMEAEVSVFGTASGRITFDMYKQALGLKEAIDELMQEEALDNDGELKVVA